MLQLELDFRFFNNLDKSMAAFNTIVQSKAAPVACSHFGCGVDPFPDMAVP
jgi:hypothetical protein